MMFLKFYNSNAKVIANKYILILNIKLINKEIYVIKDIWDLNKMSSKGSPEFKSQ